MGDIGQRIKEAAEKVGGLNRLAEITGIPRRTLGDYASGATEPKSTALVSIGRATDTDLNWLLRDDYPIGLGVSPGSGLFISDQIMLPHYDVQASAGSGRLVASHNVQDYLSVGRDWLRRHLPSWAPTNAVVGVLEGSGDSMEPTIRDGDLIIVVQDVDWRVVEQGGIFVFSLDHDRLLLKRLQVMMNGDLKIISDNTAYEPEVIASEDLAERIIIHGLVFFVGGKPRRF